MKAKLSWKDVEELITILAEKIKDKNFKCIRGIPRNGCIIAILLSHLTGLTYIENAHLLKNEDVLIVDDIADTGHTLCAYANYKIATLHYKPTSKIRPDFFAKETTDWIQYPWETDKSSKVDYNGNE